MRTRAPAIPATLAIALSLMVSFGGAMAQPAPKHLLPQSIQLEHKETLEQLTALTRKKGPVGIEATKVLALMKQHIAREEDYILPPLRLLPLLADGKVTPDMAWALPMTDRVKAEREEMFAEHSRIVDALNLLIVAATKAHDNDAKEFAESAAAGALTDLEILEPTLMLINQMLHSKLPTAK